LISVFETATVEPFTAGQFGTYLIGDNPANFACVLPVNAVQMYVDFARKTATGNRDIAGAAADWQKFSLFNGKRCRYHCGTCT
ncbi:hypothetical protein ACE3JS_25220, partial [Enterobacter hormaechei subsp. steigerwaltii]